MVAVQADCVGYLDWLLHVLSNASEEVEQVGALAVVALRLGETAAGAVQVEHHLDVVQFVPVHVYIIIRTAQADLFDGNSTKRRVFPMMSLCLASALAVSMTTIAPAPSSMAPGAMSCPS